MAESTEFLKRINAALALREIPDNVAALNQLEKAVALSSQDAYVQLLLGQTYQDLKELDKAELSFRQALAFQPDLLEAQQSLGLILVENDKYQEAITVLKPLVDADPGNETVSQALATAYEANGDFDQAIQVLKATIVLHNDRVPLLRSLANLLVSTNDMEGAIQTIDQALKVERSSSLVNLRGILLAIQGKQAEAIQYFKEAVELNPRNIGATRNLAQAYLIERDIERAMEVANQGLELFPGAEELLSIKAGILKNTDHIDEALNILEKLVSDPKWRSKYIVTYYITLLRAGRKEQALNILREEYQTISKEQREIFLQAIENAGIEEYQEGRATISKQLYEQVLEIAPAQARSINNLGFILISERSWTAALDLLKRAEAEGYEYPAILKANQGYVYINLNEPQDAIKSFGEALKGLAKTGEDESPSALLHIAYPWMGGLAENRSDDYPTWDILIKTAVLANLACAYYLQGEIQQAIETAKQAVESDPDESTSYRMLGCLYFVQGDYMQARQAWGKALESHRSKEEDAVIQSWLAVLEDQSG